ncbi:MAG: tetratricopeptide repeat protein, partial [Chitinophagaceae bacterium]
MRTFIVTLLALFSFFSSPAQDDPQKALLDQGISLYDKGDYEGAVKLFDEILSKDKNHFLASYEKTLALYASGKYEQCVDLCKDIVKRFPNESELRKVYVNYGSALDGLGKPGQAVKIYSEGIKKFPESYLLYFNRGITNYMQKETEDAIGDFKKAIEFNPNHASSHQSLAYSIYAKNKIAAIMSLSVFLLLEPEGQRATKNLKILLHLLGSNVKQEDEKNVTITLSPQQLDTKERGEDDFHMTEFLLTMRAALDNSEKYKDMPAAQKLKDKLELIVTHDAELNKKNKQGFFTRYYLPFLKQMKEDN